MYKIRYFSQVAEIIHHHQIAFLNRMPQCLTCCSGKSWKVSSKVILVRLTSTRTTYDIGTNVRKRVSHMHFKNVCNAAKCFAYSDQCFSNSIRDRVLGEIQVV